MAVESEKLKSYIYYADGSSAIFKRIEMTRKKDPQTKVEEEFYTFYLQPTRKARLKWKLNETQAKDEDYINSGEWAGHYKKTYRKEWCIALDFSPDSSVWLLLCDFKGNFKDLGNDIASSFRNRIETLKSQRDSLLIQNKGLTFNLMMLSKNPLLYMNAQIKTVNKMTKEMQVNIQLPPNDGGIPNAAGQ